MRCSDARRSHSVASHSIVSQFLGAMIGIKFRKFLKNVSIQQSPRLTNVNVTTADEA
jgi:hypothetical protein